MLIACDYIFGHQEKEGGKSQEVIKIITRLR